MDSINKLLDENEKKANKLAAFILFFLSFGLMIMWIVNTRNLRPELYNYSILIYSTIIVSCLLLSLYSIVRRYKGKNLKYLYIFVSIVSSCLLCIFHVYTGWIYFVIPIIVSIRYYDKRLVIYISILSFISLFISQIIALEFGYLTYSFDVNAIVNIKDSTNITFYGGLTKTLIMYGYINRNNIKSYLFGLLVSEYFVLSFISLLSFYAAKHGYELMCDVAKESEKAKQADMNVIISQIGPHFLYNSLTAIMAIDGNPPDTIEAIGNFGRYLRNNLNTLSRNELIGLETEIEHIKNYLYLEELRFKDKLKVEFDLKSKNFSLPPLSIQMLVENSIKHGISKKRNGGTIFIKTYEDNKYYYVEVDDDGVGFDVKQVLNNKENVGLKSSEYRLENIGAKLEVHSEINKGTKCLITLKK